MGILTYSKFRKILTDTILECKRFYQKIELFSNATLGKEDTYGAKQHDGRYNVRTENMTTLMVSGKLVDNNPNYTHDSLLIVTFLSMPNDMV
jgi:hypothetical protein